MSGLARRPPAPAPAWCQELAAALLSTLHGFMEEGAREVTLRGALADLLEQEIPDPTIVERLAQVYTVDTDQVALIALVREAQQAVAR